MRPTIASLLGAWLLLAGGAGAQNLRPADVDGLPASQPLLVAHYGAGAREYGELRLPAGTGPFPVAVVIHGGCWTAGFATLRSTAPLASALTRDGIATWNVEYRQAGDPGGGWPGTFADWNAATDYLRVLARRAPLDLARVVAVGHSAGAHAALWLASRARLPAASALHDADPVTLAGAVAIDGPGELSSVADGKGRLCGEALAAFLGGDAGRLPDRWAQADPAQRLPFGVPQALVSSYYLTPEAAAAYAHAATAAGDTVSVLDVQDGGHFDIIAPGTAAFATVEPFITHFISHVAAKSRA